MELTSKSLVGIFIDRQNIETDRQTIRDLKRLYFIYTCLKTRHKSNKNKKKIYQDAQCKINFGSGKPLGSGFELKMWKVKSIFLVFTPNIHN